MWIFPGLTQTKQIIATGVQNLSNWILGRIGEEEASKQFLRERYPSASEAVIGRVYNQIVQGGSAASSFSDLGNSIDDANIPVNPKIPAGSKYAYQVDMTVRGYKAGSVERGRPPVLGQRFHVFYSDTQLSQDELDALVIDWAANNSDFAVGGYRGEDQARITNAPYTVVSINRKS